MEYNLKKICSFECTKESPYINKEYKIYMMIVKIM